MTYKVNCGCLVRGCPRNYRCPMLGIKRCPLPGGRLVRLVSTYSRVLILRSKRPFIRGRLGKCLNVKLGMGNHLSNALSRSNRLGPSAITHTLNGRGDSRFGIPGVMRVHPPTLYRKYKRESVCVALARILGRRCPARGIFDSVNYCALKTGTPFGTVGSYISVKTSVAVTGNTSSKKLRPTITMVKSSAFARSNVAKLLSYIGRGTGIAVIVSSGRAATVANKRSSTNANHLRTVYTKLNMSPTRVHMMIPLGGGCRRVGRVVHRRVGCGKMSIVVPHERYVRALTHGGEDGWTVGGSVVLSNMNKRNVLSVTAMVKGTTLGSNLCVGRTRMRNVDRENKSMRSGLQVDSRPVTSSLVPSNGYSLVVSLRPVRKLECLPCLNRRN